jgi:hypothetical protein
MNVTWHIFSPNLMFFFVVICVTHSLNGKVFFFLHTLFCFEPNGKLMVKGRYKHKEGVDYTKMFALDIKCNFVWRFIAFVIEKFLECRCLIWARMTHLDT